VRRVNADTGERLPDVGTNICGPEGPSIDDEGNVYFNTSQTPCFSNPDENGIWMIPGGDATSAIEAVRPRPSPSPSPQDPSFTVSGTGTVFLTEEPDADKLLIAGTNSATTDFPETENIWIADIVNVTEVRPIDPAIFIYVENKKSL